MGDEEVWVCKAKGRFRGQHQAYSRLLVFLIGGNVVLLLLHLLGGDYCLLINFTLGHLPTGFALQLLVILSLLLGALARACVNAGLVAVALPRSSTYGGTGIGNACPDAGLLSLQ